MEWSDIEVFLAIAREGTLGGAARRLRTTQPTMGRRLKKLEEQLGHRLFQRTEDGFVLTDEGNGIFHHAERMEEEALALQRELSGSEQQLDGALRLSSSDWFGSHVLTPLMIEFNKQYPAVTVELITDSRLINLSRREADLVFRITPFTEADVISRRLLSVEYGLYVAKGAPMPEDGQDIGLVTMDEAFKAFCV